MVSDRISAYQAYKDARGRLFSSKTADELSDSSRDAVENWLENQLIWQELNHFKEKHEILGKHPIFAWMQRTTEIRRLRMGELFTLKENIRINLLKNKKKIRTEKNDPNTAKRVERVKQLEKEMAEVNRLLNL